jgi:S1-C subfamily serine protease
VPFNVFIPVDLLRPILADLISKGRPSAPERPWMGLNADESHGRVFITRITEDGPAGEAGLQAEDLILKVNGQPVTGLGDFFRKVWAAGSAGVEITLSILKRDEIREIRVRTGDRSKFLLMRPRKSI